MKPTHQKELEMTARAGTSEGSENFRNAASNVSDKASEFANKAGQKIDEVVEKAESVASSVAHQGREAGQQVQEVAGNLKNAVDKSVKDQPIATLLVAAALGFVVGALWKS
jgi:ElaB/YqjD/DUF883 family membrane-anchored ribosome-binding protein